MKSKFIIYKYTSPSGGVYIGQISKNIDLRAWKDGKGYLTTNKETGEFLLPTIANAIIKYGWGNFEKEVLFDNLSSEEADLKERELIEFYKSGGKCYNIASGGKGVPGVNEHKIKLYSLKGEFIREWSSIKEAEEFLNKPKAQANISACCLGRKHRAYGFIWRYEGSLLEVSPIGKYRVPIQLFTKSGLHVKTFNTIKEASVAVGVTPAAITNCLKGKSKSSGGFVWKYL